MSLTYLLYSFNDFCDVIIFHTKKSTSVENTIKILTLLLKLRLKIRPRLDKSPVGINSRDVNQFHPKQGTSAENTIDTLSLLLKL